MCFSTACLLALGLENDSRSSPEMMSTVPPPESFSSYLLWKPSASQSTLQQVSAASSRAAVMNNSPYTLDPLSFTMDMWLTLILQLVKHTALPLVCFSTPLSNILTRAPGVASRWSGQFPAVPEYYILATAGTCLGLGPGFFSSPRSPRLPRNAPQYNV